MNANDPQQQIDAYLRQVRATLRGMREEQVVEITAELRSHIVERALSSGELTADRVSAALEALGAPEELASEYVKDEVLARTEFSRSPLRLLNSLFAWATMSLAGFIVLLIAITGYFLGAALVLVAALKSFHPATAGLWSLPSRKEDLELSLRMGFGTAPANGHELLGWWIVPIGLILGCGLIVVTTKFALWCARMYRRSRPLLWRQ